jgi:hypothetical protein
MAHRHQGFALLSSNHDPAPQVFYHLGELDESLTYALGAGRLFDVTEESEYVQTLVGEWSPLLC